MRPRKLILCVDPDPAALSVLSYAMRISGYRVFSAETAIDALAIFATECIDLVLCDHSKIIDGRKLFGCMKGIASHIPMILLVLKKDIGSDRDPADALLPKTVPMVELLERVRIMSARKRGPRKGSGKPMRKAEVVAAGEAVCA